MTACAECDRPARARGLCGKHYQAAKKYDRLPPLLKNESCSEDGCPRPHHAQGYCSPHYRKLKGYKRSRPTTPSENANYRLGYNGWLTPPLTLPYRALARSCSDCGLFITTPEHLLRRDAGRLPDCPACKAKQAKRYVKGRRQVDLVFDQKVRKRQYGQVLRKQAELLSLATNSGKEWTGPEMEMLLREDLSAAVLARMLGRSFYAVRHMRRQVREPLGEALAGVEFTARDREAQRVAALVTRRAGS